MKKKYGFSLAETMIALLVLGFIFIALLRVIKTYDHTEKTYSSNGYKVIENIDGAMAKMRLSEKKSLPTGAFITKILGTDTLTFFDTSGSSIDVNEVIALFGKYLKFEETVTDVCSYTKYSCSGIKGARIYPNIYIGFKLYSSLTNCPNFYLPDSTTANTVSKKKNLSTGAMETQKCWGEVYIFLDGKNGPGIMGKDSFMLGLGEQSTTK